MRYPQILFLSYRNALEAKAAVEICNSTVLVSFIKEQTNSENLKSVTCIVDVCGCHIFRHCSVKAFIFQCVNTTKDAEVKQLSVCQMENSITVGGFCGFAKSQGTTRTSLLW